MPRSQGQTGVDIEEACASKETTASNLPHNLAMETNVACFKLQSCQSCACKEHRGQRDRVDEADERDLAMEINVACEALLQNNRGTLSRGRDNSQ
eukprot:2000543-Pleurochrysis_carterae.AAC.4